ncbi:MAG: hypothetical protein Q4G69_05915 [Planctomycetia bacterium]|nr:hypothetical protein [Planctomycetia bacterium]
MAKNKIDVYKDWLKINAANRPLNYYQLLRLKTFEDDIALIRKQYRELNAYIRKFATGDYIEESQALLNEMAKAMLCLTDAERKEDYDFRLGRKKEGAETDQVGRRTFEDVLLENRVLTPEQLKKSKMYADAVGLDLEMAIIQQKHAAPENVMMAYAEANGYPFVNLDDVPVDEYYVPQINPVLARQHSFIPILSDMGKLILASPTPLDLDVEAELQQLFRMPVRCAICTPSQVNAAIAKYYPRDAVQIFVDHDDPQEQTGAGAANPAAGPAKKTAVKKNKSKEPLSKAAKMNRLKISGMTANFAFLITMFGRYFMNSRIPAWNYVPSALIAAVILGGIAFWFTSKEIEPKE